MLDYEDLENLQLCLGCEVLCKGFTWKPDVVFIFADNMSYGEVLTLNSKWGKIPPPHHDRIVSEAMMTFTDSHHLIGLHSIALWAAD